MRKIVGVLLFVGAHAVSAQPRIRSRAVDSIVSSGVRIVITATDRGMIMVSARTKETLAVAMVESSDTNRLADSVVAVARATGQPAAGEELSYIAMGGDAGGVIVRRVVARGSDRSTLTIETPLDPEIRIFVDVVPGQRVQVPISTSSIVRLAEMIRRAIGVSRAMTQSPNGSGPR